MKDRRLTDEQITEFLSLRLTSLATTSDNTQAVFEAGIAFTIGLHRLIQELGEKAAAKYLRDIAVGIDPPDMTNVRTQ